MNSNAVARHYGTLTPEERFRLILAASGRGDEAERDRLVNAGERVALAMPDHAPFALAFYEVALLTYIELMDAAGFYAEALAHADAFAADEAVVGKRRKAGKAAGPASGGTGKQPQSERILD